MKKKTIAFLLLALVAAFVGYRFVNQSGDTVGVDISHHNKLTTADWDDLERQGVAFAYIKVSEGATYKDPMREKHRKNALKRTMHVGAYHFFRDDVSAAEQYRNFQRARGESVDYYCLTPCIDYEKDGFTQAGEKNRLATLRKLNDLFLKEYGVRPVIYCDALEYARLKSKFPRNRFWLSHNSPSMETTIQQRIRKLGGKDLDFDYTNALGALIYAD